MFDIHSHILPGVDDGASNEEETYELLKMSYAEGIRRIMTTPHFNVDLRKEIFRDWDRAFRVTERLAKEIAPDFRIYRGAEVFFHSKVIQMLEDGYPITLNNTYYILVEFPENVEFTYLVASLLQLQHAGYYPILAHVERYEALLREERIHELCEHGVYLQVNSSAITGKDGPRIKRHVLKLIQKDYIHIVGTDTHGVTFRPPMMSECVELLDKKVGEERRELLCRKHFFKIIKGE